MKMFRRGGERKKPAKSVALDSTKNIVPGGITANIKNPSNILQSFIDGSNSPIFSIGSDYCYTSFNKSHASVMKSLYGVDIQLGKSLLNYMTVTADCEKARENLDRVLSKGETVIEEAYSGGELLSRRFFDVSHSPIINRAGNIDGVLVIAQDITERKKAEEALFESEDQLRSSLENAPDGVYMNDHEGNFLYVNRKCEEISGYQREEVIGKNFLEVNLIPENDLTRAAELFQDTIKGGPTSSVALELIRKDGRRIPIEIRANVVRYKGQAVMLSFLRDVSERKRVESALQESEQSYRRLSDYHKQLNDISISFIEADDKQNLFDRITESFRLLTGAMGATFSLYDQQTRDLKVVSVSIDPVYRHKVDFLLGPDLFEMRMPISADVMEEMLSQGIRRLKDLHELSFGGIPQDISDAAMAATGCQQIIGLAMVYASELIGACAAYLPGGQPVVPDDALITYAHIAGLAVKRKRADEILQKTENTYRLLAENIHDVVWMMDMDLNVTWLSPSSVKVRGFGVDETIALPMDRQLTPESLGKAVNLWGKWMHIEQEGRTPEPGGSISTEMEFYCKDGHTVLLDCTLQFIRDENGKATGILAAGRNITERRAAERAREESENNYRLLAENTADVVTIMDMNLNITWLSSSCEKLTGYTREEQKSLPMEKQMTPESLDRAINQLAAELEREKSGTAELDRYQDMELEIYHKDGHILWTENRIRFIRDSQGKAVGILMQGRDITERKRVIEKLRQSEAQYRLLSEHTKDTVWLMDMNFNITYHSPSAEKLRGFTSREIVELPLETHVTEDSLKLISEVIVRELPRVKAEPDYNPILTLDLELYCKDGSTLWKEIKLSLIRDKDSNPVSILGEARDITERKLAEEKLEKSYASLKKTFDDAINTMVKIVEMRDPYTAGHQQKVADLSTAIAREMKFEDTRIEQLMMAAVIHDIGKMYVPSDILSKPGKLTDMEFRLVQTHSQCGYDIVKGMDFPSPVAEAVLQHHERLDGSGYPNQLKGENMLLEAKILAVADVIEAMFSHRPYRPALGIGKALEEISKNKGRLYDPDVVDACLAVFNSGRFEFKSI
ncbi:MAG: PAS domain S-box protein [Dehalococcoidia bacterium]